MLTSGVKRKRGEFISIILLIITVLFGIALSGEGAKYVKEGFDLALGCVIPSSLPFMIISDFYVCYGKPENIRIARALFQHLFGLPPTGLAPFVCGNIGGFPIGAKMSADLYSYGALTKEDAERLIPLSNNPSCAFIIGGVGVGIYGDFKIGLLLLVSVYAATLICGILTKSNSLNNSLTDNKARQSFDFVDSVKRAGVSSISIISFICIFSVINGLIKKRIKYAPLLYTLSAISEVTGAIKIFSSIESVPLILSLSLSAFSLGFGGVCVGMQSSVFTSAVGLGLKKYYTIKLMEGIISAAICSVLFTFTQ